MVTNKIKKPGVGKVSNTGNFFHESQVKIETVARRMQARVRSADPGWAGQPYPLTAQTTGVSFQEYCE